ncbi:MerR family transcriptional regulator [Actinokineospora fastidiosa]|uniref:MerR family transcriptional regulator n=1 Tax=Actinokineospora fastidiosa TaxID=1816 RepID=A0A918G8W9_9PSEU|nr:MerR family transcriptional regulator [Actinokineospora fastidiosa]
MVTRPEAACDSEPRLTVAAVARRLGIAPATLRTWDRRYGVGPTDHTTGRHRRYAPADVHRLELMQRALLQGASPAEAAEYALRAATAPQPVAPPIPPAGAGHGGGRQLLMPGAPGPARGLGRAAMAMDEVSVQRMLVDAIDAEGVAAVWDDVIRPVLAAVGGRSLYAGDCVEVEHLVTECAMAAMIRATPLVTAPRNPRPVLLGCTPDELHSLPLYVLRAALARRGLGTRMLGSAVPLPALIAAVRRTAPAAVALYAQVRAHADVTTLVHLPRTRQRVRLFACGPGWHGLDLPARVERLDDLACAVDRIESFVAGEGQDRFGS